MSDIYGKQGKCDQELCLEEGLRPSKRTRSRPVTIAAALVGRRTPASRGLQFHTTPHVERSNRTDHQNTSGQSGLLQANIPRTPTPSAVMAGPGSESSVLPVPHTPTTTSAAAAVDVLQTPQPPPVTPVTPDLTPPSEATPRRRPGKLPAATTPRTPQPDQTMP